MACGFVRAAFSIGVLLFSATSVNGRKEHSRTAECEALVRIESGLLCGKVLIAENATEYYSFRGVPYAEAPVREARFAELKPALTWEGIRDASEEGPVCPQKDIFFGHIPSNPKGMSEDCIYANVHVPRSAKLMTKATQNHKGSNFPILVSIHGGGFSSGSGNSDLYGPEFLMHLGEVIIFTFNYRVNVFGFLSLNNCQIPGNAGLRDQITFLKWVRRNAMYFGGNPYDVTIIGQSAGAASVHLLTISKAAEGLFKRVIMMSATAVPIFYTTIPAFTQALTDNFFKVLDYNTADNDKRYRLLTTLDLSELMAANAIMEMQRGIIAFTPSSEPQCENFTRVLDKEPLSAIVDGRGKDLPMLIGFVQDETQFFKWILYSTGIVSQIEKNPMILLSPRITLSYPDKAKEYTNKISQYYFNGTFTADKILDVFSDSYFLYPAMKLALWRSAMDAAPTYLYQYSYKSEMSVVKEGIWLAYNRSTHLEDLTHIFRCNTILPKDYVSFPPRNNDDRMRERMTKMVLNFINCSNPTCEDDDTSLWPAVRVDCLKYQNIVEPDVFSMEKPTPRQNSMTELFDSIDSDIRNVTEFLLSKRT